MSVTTASVGERRGAKRKLVPHTDGIDRKECAKAALALMGAFTWSKSEEGHDYWSAIHKRLLKLAGRKA